MTTTAFERPTSPTVDMKANDSDLKIRLQCVEDMFGQCFTRMRGYGMYCGAIHGLVRPMDVFSLLSHGSKDWRVSVAGPLVCLVESGTAPLFDLIAYIERGIFDLIYECVSVEGDSTQQKSIKQILAIKSEENRRSAIEIRIAIAIADVAVLRLVPDVERSDVLERAENWLRVGLEYLGPDALLIKRLRQDVETEALSPSA